jgi:acyl-coenzyme A synthetase/AMP-(fatty) acid ligase
MSAYKIPKNIKILTTLPRNAMGKVTKPDLKKLLQE